MHLPPGVHEAPWVSAIVMDLCCKLSMRQQEEVAGRNEVNALVGEIEDVARMKMKRKVARRC